MHADLQRAANYGSPGGDDDEGILRATFAEGDHAGNHGDVPEDGSGVGDEKFAVAIEDAETPRGGDEQTCAGKKDADEEDGEVAFFAVETGGDGVDEPRRGENTEEDEERGAEHEERGDGTGSFACFFFIAAGEQAGVDGNEGGGEDTFTKKILQEIGNAEGGAKGVGGVGIAEVVGEDAIADQSGNAAEKDASGDEKGETFGTGGEWGSGGGGGSGHERVSGAPAVWRRVRRIKIHDGGKGEDWGMLGSVRGGYFWERRCGGDDRTGHGSFPFSDSLDGLLLPRSLHWVVRRGPSVGMTARFNAGAADVGGKTQKAKRDPFDCVPRPRLKAARRKKAEALRSG